MLAQTRLKNTAGLMLVFAQLAGCASSCPQDIQCSDGYTVRFDRSAFQTGSYGFQLGESTCNVSFATGEESAGHCGSGTFSVLTDQVDFSLPGTPAMVLVVVSKEDQEMARDELSLDYEDDECGCSRDTVEFKF